MARFNLFRLDCPFCGEQPTITEIEGGRIEIACRRSAEIVAVVTADNERDAVLRWNRRNR